MAKGTVIAFGGGFDNENFAKIVEESIKRSGLTNPKLLFVPTGQKDRIDKKEYRIGAYEKAGCKTDILLVSKESAEAAAKKIAEADVIYATGGNLSFLTKNWNAKGVTEAMRKAYERGAVMVGVSTGAMCWAKIGYDNCGKRKLRLLRGFPRIGIERTYVFCEASNILPFCLCPHFDNISWRRFKSEAIKLDMPSIALENGAAIIYQNKKYEVMLDNPKSKVYLFYPERKIDTLDVTDDTRLLDSIDEEMRRR